MLRRDFLRTLSAGMAGAALLPATSALSAAPGTRLVILYTNDTHSRIDPFPMDGGRNQGLGGAARRAALVGRIRAENEHVLLFDSGDIFQGTPYFNFFGGEIEFKTMSAMGYDVATLGNHDFDNGVEHLAEMMQHSSFEWVSANYTVGGTPLEDKVRPYTIREKGGVRIGIFGLGISFQGLVMPAFHEGVGYEDPIEIARSTAAELRRQGCDLVVCLSHLGFRYGNSDRVSDVVVARHVPEIDLILGGHTHTFLDQPEVFDQGSRRTLVTQVGFAGIRLGRIDIEFDRSGRPRQYFSQAYTINEAIA
jgi:5'-nucleotidase